MSAGYVNNVTNKVSKVKGFCFVYVANANCVQSPNPHNFTKPNWLKDLKHKMEKDDSNSMSFEIVDKRAIEQSTNGEKSGKSMMN